MISESPPFWWGPADWRAWALWPASALYGALAAKRMDEAAPAKASIPVLCVGNFTVGGAGKTPTAIALAHAARAVGRTPGFLTRGHGGMLGASRLVDPDHDGPSVVGDEALLLADIAPTAVGVDRAAAVRWLQTAGCDFAIMDDGFQSRRLAWDLALVVVDAAHGLGNGHVIPGGPMRAPLAVQARHADALLVVGDGQAAAKAVRACARAAKPVLTARLEAKAGADFSGRRALAFCGIGHPRKFFASLADAGADIVRERVFPDHHVFSEDECAELLADAEALDAAPVTTRKDMVRLEHGRPGARALAERTLVLDIVMTFEVDDSAAALVRETAARFRARMEKQPIPAA